MEPRELVKRIKDWLDAGHQALQAKSLADAKRAHLIDALQDNEPPPALIEFEPGKVLHWHYRNEDARFPELEVLTMQPLK